MTTTTTTYLFHPATCTAEVCPTVAEAVGDLYVTVHIVVAATDERAGVVRITGGVEGAVGLYNLYRPADLLAGH